MCVSIGVADKLLLIHWQATNENYCADFSAACAVGEKFLPRLTDLQNS